MKISLEEKAKFSKRELGEVIAMWFNHSLASTLANNPFDNLFFEEFVARRRVCCEQQRTRNIVDLLFFYIPFISFSFIIDIQPLSHSRLSSVFFPPFPRISFAFSAHFLPNLLHLPFFTSLWPSYFSQLPLSIYHYWPSPTGNPDTRSLVIRTPVSYEAVHRAWKLGMGSTPTCTHESESTSTFKFRSVELWILLENKNVSLDAFKPYASFSQRSNWYSASTHQYSNLLPSILLSFREALVKRSKPSSV